MAYMSQDHKAQIRAALKTIIPATWKWSLSVHRSTSIALTIASADIDLMDQVRDTPTVSPYHKHLSAIYTGAALEIMSQIAVALNIGNWDRSDMSQDVFNVGHYVDIRIGRSKDKPFVFTGATVEA